MAHSRLSLVEFPADDPERARRFWSGLLGSELEPRAEGDGAGWETGSGPSVGVHARGRGPGDTFSLPYFAVGDLAKRSAGWRSSRGASSTPASAG